MSGISVRQYRMPLVVAALLLGTAGCEADRRTPSDELATVTLMLPVDEYALGWHWASQAQFLVFSPLVARNAEGELEPRIAKSWEHSSDYRDWTVRVDTHTRWHDGAPETAADVKFTLDLIAGETGGPGPEPYTVTVLDDSTYHIRYEKPDIGNPLDDFTVIYPKHLLEHLDAENWMEWEFWKAPVGSGPFRHVRTVEGLGFEFEANPDYFRGPPRIDRVTLLFGEPQLQYLLSGDVDVLPSTSELDMLRLRDDERFRVYRWYNPVRMKVLLWNHRSAFFGDPSVRRTLTLAVDRAEMRRAIGLPADLPIFDALYSDQQYRTRDLSDPLPFDPVEAAHLLETAGWRDTDGDGLRDRMGQPFQFTLLFDTGGGSLESQGDEAVALLIQDALRPLGIEMKLQPMDGTVAQERARRGDYDAGLVDIAGLPSRIEAFGRGNLLGWENPRVAGILERIKTAFHPDSVDSFYREMTEIFAGEHPALFLYPAITTTIAHQRIHGLSTPYRGDAVWYLEDLWIEEEEPAHGGS